MSNNPKIQLNDLLRELSGAGLIITDWVKLTKRIDILFGCDPKVEITINKKPEQLLIDVRGGVVQDIYSTSENIDATLIDWDNIEYGQEELFELGDYGVEVVTESEILSKINEANKDILDNLKFFGDVRGDIAG
ncbi:MAG TPA: hypothetical protein DC057_13460 [Spirochaetia bacterium]|nr:hypothetical protein [Spirochaetia bacterium]